MCVVGRRLALWNMSILQSPGPMYMVTGQKGIKVANRIKFANEQSGISSWTQSQCNHKDPLSLEAGGWSQGENG
jgi:hypothetical protein